MPGSSQDDATAPVDGAEGSGEAGRAGAFAARGRAINRDPKLIARMRRLRQLLPGDDRFGDPLSTAGQRQPEVVGRRLAKVSADQPNVLAEAGLGALQVWQALSEAAGRGRGEVDLAIVFTDLVEFSSWALDAGDDATLALLRDVSEAIEPPVAAHGGDIVKRLGDGMMAVFRDPRDALAAVGECCERLASVETPGYEPRMRAGIHLGRPRRIGGDYLGVDVNIAARVAAEARADEVLISDRTLEALGDAAPDAKRKRLFRAKGVPNEICVYSVKL